MQGSRRRNFELWSTFFIAQNTKILSSNGEALKQNIVFSLKLQYQDTIVKRKGHKPKLILRHDVISVLVFETSK